VQLVAEVTFLAQDQPLDEYGRALYAVTRSIIRAQLDQLGRDDLEDLNADREDVTLRQLAKLARLDRDKGMRGDGFEWAVHEAIVGGEPRVLEIVSRLLGGISQHAFKDEASPVSLLFGHERSRYLGFLDAVIENAGDEAKLLPDGRGHPFAFDKWVTLAAEGVRAEPALRSRIKQVWKTDLFLSTTADPRWVAATVKSNWTQLEAGRGLRVGIVPEATDLPVGPKLHKGLHLAVMPDPNGFMGVFNDAYAAIASAVDTLGRHNRPHYYLKPSATAQRITEQLESYATVKVSDICEALNEAAQQDLLHVDTKLVSVEAPTWLRINEQRTPVIAPRPKFEKL
jgi:hypothetical protein